MLKWGEKTFPLQPGKIYMVGREIADIVLDDSVDVKHAVVEMVDGAGVLMDMYSNAGTFVDGRKLDAMVRTTIERDSTVHFGKAETKFIPYNEHEETFDSRCLHNDLSDIVSFTPEGISCKPMTNSGFSQKGLNRNDTEYNQTKISDSFLIPETQYAFRKSVSLVENISIEDSVSNFDRELAKMQEEVDFTIPETQAPIQQSNVVESTETVKKDDGGNLAVSQFRICTQEFNGFNESSDLAEEFDNSMDASQLIPFIRHQSVLTCATTSAKVSDEIRENPEGNISTSLQKSQTRSEDSTLNVTDEQNNVLFDGNCTPDLYDLPESAQQNVQISTNILADCLPAEGSLTAVTKVKSVIDPSLFGDDNEGIMPSQKFVVKPFNLVPAVLDPENDKNLNNNNNLFVEIKPVMQTMQMLTDRKVYLSSKNENENVLKTEAKSNEMGSTKTIPTQLSAPVYTSAIGYAMDFPTQMFPSHSTPDISNDSLSPTPKVIKDTFDAYIEPKMQNKPSFLKSSSKLDVLNLSVYPKPKVSNDFDDLLSTINTNSLATKNSYRVVESHSSVVGVDKTLLHRQQNTPIVADQMEALETIVSVTPKEKAKKISGIENKILPLATVMKNLNPKRIGNEDKPNTTQKPNEPKEYSNSKTKSQNRNTHSTINKRTGIDSKTNEELSDNSVETIVASAGLRTKNKNKKQSAEKYGTEIVDISVPQKQKTRLNSQKNTEKKFWAIDEASSITQNQKKSSDADALSASLKRSTRLKSKLPTPDVDVLSALQHKINYLNTKKDSQENTDAEDIEAVSTFQKRSTRPNRKTDTTERSGPYVKCQEQIPRPEAINVHSVSQKRNPRSNSSKEPIEKALSENATTADSSLRRKTRSNNNSEIIGPPDSQPPSVSLPPKPTTHLKNTIENERKGSEVMDTSSVNAEQKTSLNQTKIGKGKRKAKIETALKDQKRSRKVPLGLKESKEEEVDVNCVSQPSSATRTLKISMTMVDPKMFKKLSLPANDIWITVQNPVESDILVMDTSNRTYKFLVAMAKGIPIVTTQYLKELSKTRILPKSEHFFADAKFERHYAFSLRTSYQLAGTRKLFAGYNFLLTSNILPPPKEIKDVIECAGGTVHQKTPHYQNNQKLYLVSTPKDKMQWHSYRRGNKDIVIVDTEAIMLSIMRQLVEPLNDHRIG